jgi:hypothetical protein
VYISFLGECVPTRLDCEETFELLVSYSSFRMGVFRAVAKEGRTTTPDKASVVVGNQV